MMLYKLGEGVLQEYKKIKGNENISPLMAQKKLTRNIMPAYKFEDDERDDLYIYGNLHITVDGDTVIKLENHKGEQHDWWNEIGKKEYYRLNKLLGIKNKKNKFRTNHRAS